MHSLKIYSTSLDLRHNPSASPTEIPLAIYHISLLWRALGQSEYMQDLVPQRSCPIATFGCRSLIVITPIPRIPKVHPLDY